MTEQKGRQGGGWWRIGIIVLVVAAVWAVFRFTALDVKNFSPTNIKDWILSLGVWGPIVFIALYASRAVILVIPVGVMSLASGLAFGELLGGVFNLVGATAGSCLSFLVARHLGRGFLDKFGFMKEGKLASFDESAARNGFRVILIARLIPVFQYDALNFGAGLSKIKFKDYFLGTFLGMAIGAFVFAFLGSSLENWRSPKFLIAIGLFLLLVLVPSIAKLVKSRRGGGGDETSGETAPDATAEATPAPTGGSEE